MVTAKASTAHNHVRFGPRHQVVHSMVIRRGKHPGCQVTTLRPHPYNANAGRYGTYVLAPIKPPPMARQCDYALRGGRITRGTRGISAIGYGVNYVNFGGRTHKKRKTRKSTTTRKGKSKVRSKSKTTTRRRKGSSKK